MQHCGLTTPKCAWVRKIGSRLSYQSECGVKPFPRLPFSISLVLLSYHGAKDKKMWTSEFFPNQQGYQRFKSPSMYLLLTQQSSCGVNQSSSEFLENQRKDLFSFTLFCLISAGPQKLQILTASKIKYEKFGPKILISH